MIPDPVAFAKIAYEELRQDGWKEIDISLFKEISTGKDAALSDDAYALKRLLINVFSALDRLQQQKGQP